MKKILLLFAVLLFFAACNNDDENTIAICESPENITITNISFQDATISWDNTNTNASSVLEYGQAGFDLGTGTTVSVNEFSLTITGLSANTTYDVYLKSICSTTNESMYSELESFTTLAPPVVAEFLNSLSALNLFSGDLADLNETIYAFDYDLITPLFTDYAHKKRIIALPIGESMEYVDDGFPVFPNNTVIAKTFFYNADERDLSLGRTIIETRVLIKRNGNWELGNYKWNDEQTEAFLDETTSTVPISYIDSDGDANTVNYVIPSNTDCFTCHNNAGSETPIGPKLRNMNMNNQLQELIDDQLLLNLTDASSVSVLPNWEDPSYSLEERARAYFEVNCAHCHIEGGFCATESDLRLSYETSYEDSNIYERRLLIDARMSLLIPGFTMPFIGTTTLHDEGYALIEEYLNSLSE